jgi:hypothetical protein
MVERLPSKHESLTKMTKISNSSTAKNNNNKKKRERERERKKESLLKGLGIQLSGTVLV